MIAPNSVKSLFAIPAGITYLNCANLSPQLRAVTAAGVAAAQVKATPWVHTAANWFSGSETLRALAAQLLGTEADAVALIPGASYGIAIGARNLPVEPGQSIVLLDEEFPSNVYAWRALARAHGARIVTVKRAPDSDWASAIEAAMGPDTAIVSVPHCHWTDGSRVDLERVATRARAVGSRLVVDASQSLGACPLDLARIQPDFLVSVGYKWLLGPYGLGYLYAAPHWREYGEPLEQSWLTRAGSEDFTRLVDYRDDYRPGARRFDAAEFPQFVLVPMAIAALQQLLAWGVADIEAYLAPLVARIAELAQAAGFSVLPESQRCRHMIGIRPRTPLPSSLSAALHDAGIYVSLRGSAIRIAPHVYNDADDVDRLFEFLRSLML